MRAVVSILLVLAAMPAYAQPKGGSEADRLFQEGRMLAKAGRHAEACDRFNKSLAIERSVGTELNLADCSEQQGHLRDAWYWYNTAATEAEKGGDAKRTKFARERAEGLIGKLGTVIIKVADATAKGLTVSLNGRQVTPAPEMKEKADPGEVEVVATAEGHPRFTKSVHVLSDTESSVDIVFAENPPETIDDIADRRRSRIRIAWVFAGIGAASGLAAGGLTLKARSDYNSTADGANCMRQAGGVVCDDTGKAAIQRAQHLADIGTLCAIGAGAMIGVATIVYLTAPHVPAQVTPTVTAQSVGLVVTGTF